MSTHDNEVPSEFFCPLTLEIMADPLMDRHGRSYERTAILQWIVERHCTCPITRQPLSVKDLIPNHRLRKQILQWRIIQGEDTTESIATLFDESSTLKEASRTLTVCSPPKKREHGRIQNRFGSASLSFTRRMIGLRFARV